MSLYRFGRGARCDVVLDAHAVSKRHAELTVARDGRLYLTDCASRNGTKVWRDGRWQTLRQSFVAHDERVRFGTVELTVAALIERIPRRESAQVDRRHGGDNIDIGNRNAQTPSPNSLPHGPVKRHPTTGEIMPS